jgi:hypothetical protein
MNLVNSFTSKPPVFVTKVLGEISPFSMSLPQLIFFDQLAKRTKRAS